MTTQGEQYKDADELAVTLGKEPTGGGHWNSGISVLRSNGPIQADGRLTERRRYFANNLVLVLPLSIMPGPVTTPSSLRFAKAAPSNG